MLPARYNTIVAKLIEADKREWLLKQKPQRFPASVWSKMVDWAIGVSNKYAPFLLKWAEKDPSFDANEQFTGISNIADESLRWGLKHLDRVKKLKEVDPDWKDLKNYWDAGEFLRKMRSVEHMRSEREKEEDRKTGVKTVLEKGPYKVLDIETPEASMELCKGTGWCTAHWGKANDYLKAGPLWMLLKNNEPYVLFSPAKGHMKNLRDQPLTSQEHKDQAIQNGMRTWLNDEIERLPTWEEAAPLFAEAGALERPYVGQKLADGDRHLGQEMEKAQQAAFPMTENLDSVLEDLKAHDQVPRAYRDELSEMVKSGTLPPKIQDYVHQKAMNGEDVPTYFLDHVTTKADNGEYPHVVGQLDERLRNGEDVPNWLDRRVERDIEKNGGIQPHHIQGIIKSIREKGKVPGYAIPHLYREIHKRKEFPEIEEAGKDWIRQNYDKRHELKKTMPMDMSRYLLEDHHPWVMEGKKRAEALEEQEVRSSIVAKLIEADKREWLLKQKPGNLTSQEWESMVNWAVGVSTKYAPILLTWAKKNPKRANGTFVGLPGVADDTLRWGLKQLDRLKKMPTVDKDTKTISEHTDPERFVARMNETKDLRSEREKEEDRKNSVKTLLEKGPYKIEEIKTPEAAMEECANTSWCTAHWGKANEYINAGPLYLLKKDNKPYVLFSPSKGHMKDTADDSLQSGEYLKSVQNMFKDGNTNDYIKRLLAKPSNAEVGPLFAEVGVLKKPGQEEARPEDVWHGGDIQRAQQEIWPLAENLDYVLDYMKKTGVLPKAYRDEVSNMVDNGTLPEKLKDYAHELALQGKSVPKAFVRHTMDRNDLGEYQDVENRLESEWPKGEDAPNWLLPKIKGRLQNQGWDKNPGLLEGVVNRIRQKGEIPEHAKRQITNEADMQGYIHPNILDAAKDWIRGNYDKRYDLIHELPTYARSMLMGEVQKAEEKQVADAQELRRQRDIEMHGEPQFRAGKKTVNEYAVCTDSVGRENEAKYKRCKEEVVKNASTPRTAKIPDIGVNMPEPGKIPDLGIDYEENGLNQKQQMKIPDLPEQPEGVDLDQEETSPAAPAAPKAPAVQSQPPKKAAAKEPFREPAVEDMTKEKSRKEGSDETAAVGAGGLDREKIKAPSLIGQVEGTRTDDTPEMSDIFATTGTPTIPKAERVIAMGLVACGDHHVMAEEVYGPPANVELLEEDAKKATAAKRQALRKATRMSAIAAANLPMDVLLRANVEKALKARKAGYDAEEAATLSADGEEPEPKLAAKVAAVGLWPDPKKYAQLKRVATENIQKLEQDHSAEVTTRTDAADAMVAARQVEAGVSWEKHRGRNAAHTFRMAVAAEAEGRPFQAALLFQASTSLMGSGPEGHEKVPGRLQRAYRKMVAVDSMAVESAAKEGKLVGLNGSALADFVAEKTGLDRSTVAVLSSRWEEEARTASALPITSEERGVIADTIVRYSMDGLRGKRLVEAAAKEAGRYCSGLTQQELRKVVTRMAAVEKAEQVQDAEKELGPLADEEVRTGSSSWETKWQKVQKQYKGNLVKLAPQVLRHNLGREKIQTNRTYRIKGNRSAGIIVLGKEADGELAALIVPMGQG